MAFIKEGIIAGLIVESMTLTMTFLFSRMEGEVEKIFPQRLTLTLQTN